MARFLLLALAAGFPVTATFAQPAPAPPAPVEGFPTPSGQGASEKKKPAPPPQGKGRPSGEARKDERGSRPDKPREDWGPRGDDERRERLQQFRQKMENMTEEERARFAENFKRWRKMADAEREEWKKRMAEERERIEKTIDDAVRKAGLQLTGDEKEVFALRYRQERRKVEEDLRREMDARRTEKLDGMIEKLKAEFAGRSPAAPGPSPEPTSTPAQP